MKLLLLPVLAAVALAGHADYAKLQFAQFQEQHGRRESTSSVTLLKQNSRQCILVDISASLPQLVISPLCQSLPRISPPKLTGGSKELSLMSRTRDSVDLAGLSAPLR